MKFLFIAPRFHTNQHFWVKALFDHGHEVQLWVRKKQPLENYSALIPEVLDKWWWNIPSPIAYYRRMKVWNPDVIIVRDPRAFLFAFVLMCVARVQGRRIIIYTQTPLHQKMSFVKRILVKVILWFFRAVWITPAKGNKNEYAKFHPNAFYVPFVIEVSQVPQVRSLKKNVIRIISVGKLYQAKKNHLFLLEIVARLKKEFNLHVTIIGARSGDNPKYFEKMKEFIATYNLDDRVCIKTDMPHEKILDEYSQHDLFVLPTSGDLLAYSPLEAMAAGLPVICSDTNGARWYIQEEGNGYIFQSGNIDDLETKIRMVISDKERMQKMQKRSYELAREKHTPEVFYERLMKILQTT